MHELHRFCFESYVLGVKEFEKSSHDVYHDVMTRLRDVIDHDKLHVLVPHNPWVSNLNPRVILTQTLTQTLVTNLNHMAATGVPNPRVRVINPRVRVNNPRVRVINPRVRAHTSVMMTFRCRVMTSGYAS